MSSMGSSHLSMLFLYIFGFHLTNPSLYVLTDTLYLASAYWRTIYPSHLPHFIMYVLVQLMRGFRGFFKHFKKVTSNANLFPSCVNIHKHVLPKCKSLQITPNAPNPDMRETEPQSKDRRARARLFVACVPSIERDKSSVV